MSSLNWVFYQEELRQIYTKELQISRRHQVWFPVNRRFCFDLGTTHGDLPFEAPLNQDWIDPKRLIGNIKESCSDGSPLFVAWGYQHCTCESEAKQVSGAKVETFCWVCWQGMQA